MGQIWFADVELGVTRSKPDRGIVETRFALVNQRGQAVMVTRGGARVARRPPHGSERD